MKRDRSVLYIVFAGFISFTVGGFIFVSNSGIDNAISQSALSLQGDTMDVPMRVLSMAGTPPAVLLVSIVITILLLRHKMKRELIFYWIAILSNALLTSAIKHFVARERPFPRMEDINSYSFPSWHASTAMALSVAILLILASKDLKYRWWILIWGFAVGCSRVYLNVHWCSDVLAGWGLGAFVSATAGYFILRDNLIFGRKQWIKRQK